MKTRMLGVLTITTLLGATLATASLAQDRQRDVDARGRGPQPPAERFIARFDTDGDGRVSAAEFTDARLDRVDRYFEQRDTDGDGLISAAEQAEPRAKPERGKRMRGMRRGRAAIDQDALAACVQDSIADGESRADAVATADTNADGALSLQEISAALERRAQEQFARLDADDDGYVTAGEASAQRDAQQDLRRVTRTCLQQQRRG
ncbi:MAG: hypothetical protein SV422_07595 [Pseudomonadota bacterium]|nr:hypothetical protein [Pseudomonadota bacterium]